MLKHLTLLCVCAVKKETAAHVILSCKLLINEREAFRRDLAPLMLKTKADLAATTDKPESAKKIAYWLLAVGRLTMYNLAE